MENKVKKKDWDSKKLMLFWLLSGLIFLFVTATFFGRAIPYFPDIYCSKFRYSVIKPGDVFGNCPPGCINWSSYYYKKVNPAKVGRITPLIALECRGWGRYQEDPSPQPSY